MGKVLVTDYVWENLSLEEDILKNAGANLIVAKTGSEEELLQLAADVDGIMTCWKNVSGNVLKSATRCVSVGRFGIGLDNIDVRTATGLGMIVTNVPAYCVDEVSDHAMALILSCARKTAFYDRNIKAGTYNLQAGPPLYRIKGKTLGILGFGKIGKALSAKAKPFGLKVIAHDPYLTPSAAAEFGVQQVSFTDLLQTSDFISIHVPLSAETSRMFNYEAFQKMKRDAIIVNTSRGDVVDSAALRKALDEGLIAGAGLDVLSEEPPRAQDPLILHPKTVITPHAAFNSVESLLELRTTAAQQMADALQGNKPSNIVNPDVLNSRTLRAAAKN